MTIFINNKKCLNKTGILPDAGFVRLWSVFLSFGPAVFIYTEKTVSLAIVFNR